MITGFELNGFINHYPDFIVRMKNGKTILIETKDDHMDGSDNKNKLRLGEKWTSKAGDEFRYFMVFETERLKVHYCTSCCFTFRNVF